MEDGGVAAGSVPEARCGGGVLQVGRDADRGQRGDVHDARGGRRRAAYRGDDRYLLAGLDRADAVTPGIDDGRGRYPVGLGETVAALDRDGGRAHGGDGAALGIDGLVAAAGLRHDELAVYRAERPGPEDRAESRAEPRPEGESPVQPERSRLWRDGSGRRRGQARWRQRRRPRAWCARTRSRRHRHPRPGKESRGRDSRGDYRASGQPPLADHYWPLPSGRYRAGRNRPQLANLRPGFFTATMRRG